MLVEVKESGTHTGRSALGADDHERGEADQQRPVGVRTLQVLPPLLCAIGGGRAVLVGCAAVRAHNVAKAAVVGIEEAAVLVLRVTREVPVALFTQVA